MSAITDTIMNIEIFAYVALLVWLYFKPMASKDD